MGAWADEFGRYLSWVELIGYLGTAFTIWCYAVRTIIPLRILGAISSVFFVVYGILIASPPVWITELILLPINLWRLRQMLQLVKSVEQAASTDLSMEWLEPYGTPYAAKAGSTVFRKGDRADAMFYTLGGRYRLRESGIELGAGQIIGEMGLVSDGNRRTQSLDVVEAGEMLKVDYDAVKQLYFQNPEFGFYFLKLVSRRLFENVDRAEASLMARGGAPVG